MSKREQLTGKFFTGGEGDERTSRKARSTEIAEKIMNSQSKLMLPKNDIEIMAEQMRDEKEAKSTFEKLFEIEKAKQDEIDAKIEKLELIPMRANVLILPYPSNPYRKILDKETGIYFAENKYYKNPDTGEMEESDNVMEVATVMAVGPDVKYIKEGDVIYYRRVQKVPIPFFRSS